jgi:hypothetical protein
MNGDGGRGGFNQGRGYQGRNFNPAYSGRGTGRGGFHSGGGGTGSVRVEAVSTETIADQGFSRENQVVPSEIGRMPLVAVMSRAITEVIRPIFTAVPIQILTSETIVVMLGIKVEDNIMAIIV